MLVDAITITLMVIGIVIAALQLAQSSNNRD